MEENEILTPEIVLEPETSKTPLVVAALALVGAGAVAKKGFDKVRKLRVVSKERLENLEKNQTIHQVK